MKLTAIKSLKVGRTRELSERIAKGFWKGGGVVGALSERISPLPFRFGGGCPEVPVKWGEAVTSGRLWFQTSYETEQK